MSSSPVQTGRLLTLTTPLGGDVLLATSLEGTEGLSQLFTFTLHMTSTNTSISADQLLGKPLTVKIARARGEPRIINGIVSSFAAADRRLDGMRRYRAVLRPKLWLLTRTSDCRIFQNQTVLQITALLLGEGGVSDYRKRGLTGSHPSRTYCVQYRETDFDFLTRIWAEEGVYFYFQHHDSQHTLVLCDSPSGYCDCLDASVEHAPVNAADNFSVQRWRLENNFASGSYSLRDYNFAQPATDLTSSTPTVVSNAAFREWELFDYPGGYALKDHGTSLSRLRMEEVETSYEVAHGESTCRGFMAGAKFTMAQLGSPPGQGKTYVLASLHHEAHEYGPFGDPDKPSTYRNRFTALPASIVFRPSLTPCRPLVPGPQTATVVGPSTEDIYCDSYGRVRVQFHWDRLGKNDEKSSCWIRVGQILAGPGWGSQFIPRVGMEVIVTFLNGDPDQPLVVGAVYNGQNTPPYSLPDNKTQSGFRTCSTNGGNAATFNELRFEDKKDSESLYIHAQKDFTRVVRNDDTLNVQNDQTVTVRNHRTEIVEEGDQRITVSKGNRTITTSRGDDTTDIARGNYAVKLGAGNATHQCDRGSISLQAAKSITLTVGGNSIVIDQTGITLKATQITLTADAKIQASGPMVKVCGDGVVEVKGGLVTIN